MTIRYKSIEIPIKAELDNYSHFLQQLPSLIRGANINADQSKIHDEDIDLDLIELIGDNEEEVKFINHGFDEAIGESVYCIIKPRDPTTSEVLFKGNKRATFMNSLSGEFFVCTNQDVNNQIWRGQCGQTIQDTITFDDLLNRGTSFYYKFNEMRNNTITEAISGQQITGSSLSSRGSLKTDARNFDKAAYFKSNSKIKIPDTHFNFSGNLTLSFLIKPRSQGYNYTIMETSWHSELALVVEQDRSLTMYHGDGTYFRAYNTNISLDHNKWTHVILRKSGSSVEIYFGEDLISTTHWKNVPNGQSLGPINNSGLDLNIGKGVFGGGSFYFDELIAFERIVDLNEMQLLVDRYKDE